MRYMKPIVVGKISSINNQLEELNRVNEVMHTSKFHENTEHKVTLKLIKVTPLREFFVTSWLKILSCWIGEEYLDGKKT